MTNKVQKILSEIATRKLCTMDEHMAFYNDTAKEDYRFLSEIEELIKVLQEEPVSESPNIESMIESYKQRLISQANGVKNSPLIDMCLASYKHGINETLDTLKLSNLVRIGKREPKFKVGDRIKFKGIHNEDVTRVITDIKEGEGVGFRYFFADGSIYSIGDDGIELVEEPVSDELEEASRNYADNEEYGDDVYFAIEASFEAGAKWQEAKDKQVLNEEGVVVLPEEEFERMKRSLIKLAEREQQMMAKAFPVEIDSSRSDGRCILSGNFARFETGDKVKVIVIKED